MDILSILGFLVAAVFGVLFVLTRRNAARTSEKLIQTEKFLAMVEVEAARVNDLVSRADHYESLSRALERDLGIAKGRADRVPILEETLSGAQRTIAERSAEIERLKAELANEQSNAQEKLSMLAAARQELSDHFAALSKKALEDNNKAFTDFASQTLNRHHQTAQFDLDKRQQAIQELVNPLRERIQDFEQKVDDAYKAEAAERNMLKGEIGKLVDLNQRISQEAHNLTTALKGDTKKQGNWGEMILSRILESSGLEKDREYIAQAVTTNAAGDRIIPDAVILLPEDKHLIIDSKVSLVAYERYVAAETDEERAEALKDHVASVRSHISILAAKRYPSGEKFDSPELTLLFMPIESSFGLSVQADQHIFEYAWDRQVVIVSPSTLLATLRTVASIWKQEKQTRSAIDIAKRAGKLYDKFVNFAEDMSDIGKHLKSAQGAHDKAMNKLSTGNGNLVKKAEELKTLGAKAQKAQDAGLLERSDNELLGPSTEALPALSSADEDEGPDHGSAGQLQLS